MSKSWKGVSCALAIALVISMTYRNDNGGQMLLRREEFVSVLSVQEASLAKAEWQATRKFDDPHSVLNHFSEDGAKWFEPLYALQAQRKTIAFVTTATGKYVRFIPRLVDSINRFALLHHNVHVHVFTDQNRTEMTPYLVTHPGIFIHKVEHAGWPTASLKRFGNYVEYCEGKGLQAPPPGFPGSDIPVHTYDYIYAIDADAAMADFVNEEILSEWVGTMHIENAHFDGTEVSGFMHLTNHRKEHADQPGLYHDHGAALAGRSLDAFMNPPLQTSDSTLNDFVQAGAFKYYFYGGFYGGNRTRFCASVKEMFDGFAADVARGHHSPVDDETYVNALNFRNPPTRVLTSAYMHPDYPNSPLHPWVWDNFNNDTQHNRFSVKIVNVWKNKGELLG